MKWMNAIQAKRQQWVAMLARARRRGRDRNEQALTNLMTQLGEFETAYQAHRQSGLSETESIAHLQDTICHQWPELWATMSSYMPDDLPDAWVKNPFVVVADVTEAMIEEGQEFVGFESRMNQLDAMPLSQETITLMHSLVDEAWKSLRQHMDDTRARMEQWEYAACMHRLGTYFLAFYSTLQVEAIAAIKAAEEAGQLTSIVTDDEQDQ